MAQPTSNLTARSPRLPRRSDSRATQAKLIASTGRLLQQHQNLNFNMADLAREAEVSPATVYRYFHSIEEAIETYISGFVDDVVARRERRPKKACTGALGLYTLGEDYVRTADRWGSGMIHVRSPVGFLARRRAGDRIIVTVADLASDVIVSGMEELGLELRDLDFALLLWNGIFDPREIAELRNVQKWSVEEVSDRLTSAFIGAISASPGLWKHKEGDK
ncbi:MAG TPA: TetR/AcrR family transcriptional regulator [Solirubrobacterales bacterium]|jgi:AcrR family transcriptional regulator|nr:TetR/AcrR family transcriptional regulator [Solirubrobacterales bacterium]